MAHHGITVLTPTSMIPSPGPTDMNIFKELVKILIKFYILSKHPLLGTDVAIQVLIKFSIKLLNSLFICLKY